MTTRKPPQTTVGATDVQRRFGEVLKRVFNAGEHVIIERAGLPVAVILSISEYQALMQARDRAVQDREERLRKFREAARAIGEDIQRMNLTEADLMQILEEERQRLHEAGNIGQP